jgi:hypothetical protein
MNSSTSTITMNIEPTYVQSKSRTESIESLFDSKKIELNEKIEKWWYGFKLKIIKMIGKRILYDGKYIMIEDIDSSLNTIHDYTILFLNIVTVNNHSENYLNYMYYENIATWLKRYNKIINEYID